MGIRGTERQIDNIAFYFIYPDGHELAVWTAQA